MIQGLDFELERTVVLRGKSLTVCDCVFDFSEAVLTGGAAMNLECQHPIFIKCCWHLSRVSALKLHQMLLDLN